MERMAHADPENNFHGARDRLNNDRLNTGWPRLISSNEGVMKYVYEPCLHELISAEQSCEFLHEAVSQQIKRLVESIHDVSGDKLANPMDYEIAASNLFASKLFQAYGDEVYHAYFKVCMREISYTRPITETKCWPGLKALWSK